MTFMGVAKASLVLNARSDLMNDKSKVIDQIDQVSQGVDILTDDAQMVVVVLVGGIRLAVPPQVFNLLCFEVWLNKDHQSYSLQLNRSRTCHIASGYH